MSFPTVSALPTIKLSSFDIFDNLYWSPNVWDNSVSKLNPTIHQDYNILLSFPSSIIPSISIESAKKESTYSSGSYFVPFSNWARYKYIYKITRGGSPYLCTCDMPLVLSAPGVLVGVAGDANFTRHGVDPITNEITSLASDGYFSSSSFETILESNFDVMGMDGTSVFFKSTNTDFKQKYKNAPIFHESNWEFGKSWAIKEDVSYPLLLKRGDPKPGIPGESVKRVIFVDKHDDGTMFYNGEIYRSMKMSQLISKFVGATGEEVTQVWEGEKQVAPDGNTYVFLASGVQDPDFPGGYGGYTDEQSRTVTLRSDRSIDVNFYYTAMELPPYNYLMRVAVPDGIAHIAIMKADVSSIKVQMHDGSICTVDIVLPDDEQASPIRVMLPTGIYALKKIEIND